MQTTSSPVPCLFTHIAAQVAQNEMSEFRSPHYPDVGFRLTEEDSVNNVIQKVLLSHFLGAVSISKLFVDTCDNRTFVYTAEINRSTLSTYKVCGQATLHTEVSTYTDHDISPFPKYTVRTFLVITWTDDNR